MATAIQAIQSSYLTPTRQLGQVSSSQTQLVSPEETSQDEIVKQQIIDTVFPASERRNQPGFNAGALQVVIDTINAGHIIHYYDDASTSCTQANKTSITNLQLANKAAALTGSLVGLGIGTAAHASALATIGIGVNIAPVVGQIIAGAIAAFAVISSIFGHHAQAVIQEQTILCFIIPEIDKAVFGLDAAIQNGSISLKDAYAGMDTLHTAYLSQVKPILQMSATTCNAACVMNRAVLGLILWKKYQYSVVVNSNPVSAISNTISSATGLPVQQSKTLLYVIAAVLLYFIAKSL